MIAFNFFADDDASWRCDEGMQNTLQSSYNKHDDFTILMTFKFYLQNLNITVQSSLKHFLLKEYFQVKKLDAHSIQLRARHFLNDRVIVGHVGKCRVS
jgi:hypothetical protein